MKQAQPAYTARPPAPQLNTQLHLNEFQFLLDDSAQGLYNINECSMTGAFYMRTVNVSSERSGHIGIGSRGCAETLKSSENALFSLRKPHAHYTCVWTRLCHT